MREKTAVLPAGYTICAYMRLSQYSPAALLRLPLITAL